MIPLRDENPTRTVPFVTWSLIAANVAAFAYELSLGADLDPLVRALGLIPERVFAAKDPGTLALPFFSSMFLHGGFLHLGANMLYLHIFGDNVEDRLGHARYLFVYLGCGLAAGIAQVGAFPESTVPMVGASGAIAGITGAYFVFFPKAKVVAAIPVIFYVQLVRVPAIFFLLVWFALQLWSGAVALEDPSAVGGVAWWAHIGGFVAGIAVALAFAPPGRRARR